MTKPLPGGAYEPIVLDGARLPKDPNSVVIDTPLINCYGTKPHLSIQICKKGTGVVYSIYQQAKVDVDGPRVKLDAQGRVVELSMNYPHTTGPIPKTNITKIEYTYDDNNDSICLEHIYRLRFCTCHYVSDDNPRQNMIGLFKDWVDIEKIISVDLKQLKSDIVNSDSHQMLLSVLSPDDDQRMETAINGLRLS